MEWNGMEWEENKTKEEISPKRVLWNLNACVTFSTEFSTELFSIGRRCNRKRFE